MSKGYAPIGDEGGGLRVLGDGRTLVEVPIVGSYNQDVIRTSDGLLWISGRGSQDALAINHEMYPPGKSIHDYICGHFKPGLVFLDIGAHVGHYALRAARAGCAVCAVEANPECSAQLRMNMVINQVTSITVWAVAAWDRHELLQFNAGPEDQLFRSGGNSVMPAGTRPASRTDLGITVAGIPLDDLLASIDRVDLVKMDVEGADLRVLDGMKASLARLRPKLIIEDHSQYDYFTPEEFDAKQAELTELAGYAWTTAAAEGVEGLTNYRIGMAR